MLVRTVEERREAGWEKVLNKGLSRSVRFVTAADRIGFSFHMNRRTPGMGRDLWYKNHWEANLTIGGEGVVTDLATGKSWPMRDGTMHIVGPKDRHTVEAKTDLHVISVFCPALAGDELHDADGSLAPSGPIPPGPPEG